MNSSDPYTGQVNLTFAPGLPTGVYRFLALSSKYGKGLSDAAGNAFGGYANEPAPGGSQNFELDFNLQPTPTFITDYEALTPDSSSPSGFDNSGVRSNYELPVPGITPRAAAPPTAFTIDFSNPLNPNTDYTNAVQLVRSADSATASPDGNFGDLGITNTSGYTTIKGISVKLENSVAGAVFGQYGYNNRLLITLPAGLTLPADYYRVYLPNNAQTPITDVYGNQLDGEFLGYQNASGKYVDQLQTGQVRGSGASELPDLTGDGTSGGAFMTGFVVVPNGNIIYARADALYSPQIPSQTPDGSFARPYPVLAPEAVPTAANGGDLNSVVNSGANFDKTYDRSGDGQFEPSAFFAAQQKVQANGGPVVILAEQSIPTRDPNTGQTIQQPFVLQAPSPSGNQVATIANDASAAIPAMTTLRFDVGTIVKMQNAAILVQNQGSALQVTGGPNSYQGVVITSYKDSSVGGISNGDPNSTPTPGDYGGLIFRNFSQAALPGSSTPRPDLFPGQLAITGNPTSDNRLKGPFADPNNPASQVDAISGADDIMSSISFLTEKFAGGPVPVTIGTGTSNDGITLIGSRPAIVNSIIANAGGAGSAQAGLSVNVDALRADDVAQGPLIRNDQFLNNGLNGIYIRGQVASGVAEPTDSVVYPSNPSVRGGTANYVLNSPYPYLLTTRMIVGENLVEQDNTQAFNNDRLYVVPGSLVKFQHGAALEVLPGASLNVGDQTYIKEYDNDHLIGPTYGATLPNGQPNPLAGQKNPNFKANSALLAQVVFTSLNDDSATTSYFDPITQVTTQIVAALPSLPGGSGALQPTPTLVPDEARWGGVTIDSGAVGVINSTNLRYGGGLINTAGGSATQHVLELGGGGQGSRSSITNNLFTNDSDVPVNLSPNALLAADPSRPLNSGDPFIHGNVFLRNDFNGVGVQGGTGNVNRSNLSVNSVWTGSDFTYILRDTIVLAGGFLNIPSNLATTLLPEPKPAITLTLQSTLPGTILADGTTVAAPGVPLIIKLMTTGAQPPSEMSGVTPTPSIPESFRGGAGFIVGVDNGVDPTTDSLIDPGLNSQIRILGIPGNQTTGQTRVPVIITSVRDNTVGTTVNNVALYAAHPSDPAPPKAGDGGVIYFGGNSLTDYSPQDPRDGSVIDNADIRYITRIEQQGNGLIYGTDSTNSNAFVPDYNIPAGLGQGGSAGFLDQYNLPKQLTISNSNLSTFSDVGFRAHPGHGSLIYALNYPSTPSIVTRNTGFIGEPTHTYFVNDTITNMVNTAVELISELPPDNNPTGPFTVTTEAVFLNNTFDNNGVAIHTFAPPVDGVPNVLSNVAFLAMDNIFSNSKTTAVVSDGRRYGSDLQYNLFSGNAADLGGTNAPPNNQPISGLPQYRDPSTGNYFLLADSAAIDRARSELGPSFIGNMISPAVTIDPNNLAATPIRNQTGGSNLFGQYDSFPLGLPIDPRVDYVTLPGESITQRQFPDQWIPVLASSGLGSGGTGSNAATYFYQPVTGVRDQVGNLRIPDTKSMHVGAGTRPFFDLGAFEYIAQNPPVVDSVIATSTTGTSNIYGVGSIAGINKLPTSIQIKFNERLDPSTISGMSVILLASGGDGIFGNGNSAADRAINVSGKLTFDPNSDILTIDTSGIFTSTATANDEYRVILKGTGSSVIRDNSGVPLDGMNLDANGNQLPLPSGADNFPGSDFQVTFTIDTNPPSIVKGSFVLDPASDTSGGRNITKINLPTFDGKITDIFPPTNFLQGQSVHIDISTKGDGVFDLLDAGIGTTDASGNFRVTLTKAIPDTPNTIGAGGIKGASGATYALARVRIIDQAGNPSNLPTDPFSQYNNEGAATALEVDTRLPRVSSLSPVANTVATVNANGQVIVTVVFDENIKTSTLNAGSVLVQRTGGTGNFSTPVAVPIVASSFTTTYSTAPMTLGYETVTFAIAGPLANDQYRVVLKGTGNTPITDIAANPLDGQGIGSASDYNSGPFVVYSASRSHLIYVQAPSQNIGGTGTQGTRENPFTTIAAGIKAALVGDVVLVLPGSYVENVALKPGVRLLSASLSSSDTSFTAGSPYQTLIYGVATANPTTGTANTIVTVGITGATPGIPTEVSGFAIICPLLGDPNFGPIDSTSVGVQAIDSDAHIDRNLVINAGLGVNVAITGSNTASSQVFDNVIAGNINGVRVSDSRSATSAYTPFLIANNTIVDNTTGLYNVSSKANYNEAFVVNNIFFSNHDLTAQRAGTGIASYALNTLIVGANLFYANGPSSKPESNANGAFQAFIPSALTTTPDALGNLIGNPFFAQPEDPRPNGNSPAVFLNYSNFDLTARSVAINAGINSFAPASDILYRTPVPVANHGFPGYGPASIGAYYFGGKSGPSGGVGIIYMPPTTATGTTGGAAGTITGTGTRTGVGNMTTPVALGLTGNTVSAASVVNSPIGGGIALGTRQFSVVTTSLSNGGTVHAADATGVIATEAGPTFIDVNFSNDIKPSSLSPADLVLSGSGLNPANPAKATSLAWIDDHAVRFFLSGSYNNSGTVKVSLPDGAISDTKGAALVGFTDSFQLASNTPPSPATPVNPAAPTTTVTPTTPVSNVLPLVQPVAAAAPVAVATPHKLTAKEIKQHAAQVKAQHAAEAKAAKAAAQVKAAQAKAAHKAKKTR